MEKLLDLDHERPAERYKCYRFQCECLTSGHAMDIDAECWDSKDNKKALTIRCDFWGTGFASRIKYAWQILMGHWTWAEFIPREEDYGNLAEIFDPTKGYMNLP